jgi:hypothetical protein
MRLWEIDAPVRKRGRCDRNAGGTRFSRSGWRLSVAVLLVASSGCGGQGDRPPLGRVSGTVTLDGQPLPDVRVTFAPESGRPSAGRTDGSGRYELLYVLKTKGAKVGKHRVFIDWPAADEEDENAPKTQDRPKIPPRYNRQTTLTGEVRSGANTLDFALESK